MTSPAARPLRRICVFCGSSAGGDPRHAEAAVALGRVLAEASITLVYGGGNIGLMGVVADAVLDNGGEVIGVIPHALMARELGHTGIQDLRIVDTMHERKALMADLADAFIALPGGIGTLDELCEILGWGQLGVHHKPMGLLDPTSFFAGFLSFLDHAVDEGFFRREQRDMLLVDDEPRRLLDRFAGYRSPVAHVWVERRDR